MIRWGMPRPADWLALSSFGVIAWAFAAGFGPKSDRAVVLFGSLSCLFWLFASTVPIYVRWLRDNTDVLNGLNSFAAAATGATVIASEPHAWSILIG